MRLKKNAESAPATLARRGCETQHQSSSRNKAAVTPTLIARRPMSISCRVCVWAGQHRGLRRTESRNALPVKSCRNLRVLRSSTSNLGGTRTTVEDRPTSLGQALCTGRLLVGVLSFHDVVSLRMNPLPPEDARRHSFSRHEAGVDCGGWASCRAGLLCPCSVTLSLKQKLRRHPSTAHGHAFPRLGASALSPALRSFADAHVLFSRPSCTSCGSVSSPTDVCKATCCVHQRGQHHCLRQHMYNLVTNAQRCQPPCAHSAFSTSMSKAPTSPSSSYRVGFFGGMCLGNKDFLKLPRYGAGR